jgi:hypothetical protein
MCHVAAHKSRLILRDLPTRQPLFRTQTTAEYPHPDASFQISLNPNVILCAAL